MCAMRDSFVVVGNKPPTKTLVSGAFSLSIGVVGKVVFIFFTQAELGR